MKKLTLILSVLILSALLGACGAADVAQTEQVQPTLQPAASLDVSSAEAEGPPSPPICIPNPPRPEPSAEDLAAFSANPETDWIKGPVDAAITIVEYADFQCPYCSVASQNLKLIMEKYPDDGSMGEQVVPVATTVSKNGYESMAINKVEKENVGAALDNVAIRMIEYRNIEGFNYEVNTGSTAEEGLARLGVK